MNTTSPGESFTRLSVRGTDIVVEGHGEMWCTGGRTRSACGTTSSVA